jgi:hypothetical protein
MPFDPNTGQFIPDDPKDAAPMNEQLMTSGSMGLVAPVQMAPVQVFSDQPASGPIYVPAGGVGGDRLFVEHAPSMCPCCRMSPMRKLILEQQSGRIVLQTKQMGCCKHFLGADEMTTVVHARKVKSVTHAREGTSMGEKLALFGLAGIVSGLMPFGLMPFGGPIAGIVLFPFVFIGLLMLHTYLKPSGVSIYVHEGPVGEVFIPLKKKEALEARDLSLILVDQAHMKKQ